MIHFFEERVRLRLPMAEFLFKYSAIAERQTLNLDIVIADYRVSLWKKHAYEQQLFLPAWNTAEKAVVSKGQHKEKSASMVINASFPPFDYGPVWDYFVCC